MRGRTRIRRDDRTNTSADAEPGGACVVTLVIVPMGALVIAPMVALIAAPMDALVVAPLDAPVTVPMDTLVVAPVIAPMNALLVAPMVAVVIRPMDALVTAPMLCGAGLLTMISRGRNECLHPRRSRDTNVIGGCTRRPAGRPRGLKRRVDRRVNRRSMCSCSARLITDRLRSDSSTSAVYD